MIESRYWKDDLIRYAKSFQPVANPPRWSEKQLITFEKEVVLAFFMVRKLWECGKFSSTTKKQRMKIFRCPNTKRANAINYWDIGEIYELPSEHAVSKSVPFVCNQFIHGGATFAYREDDRNWGGLYTCSDYERQKFIYRIPISEIISILLIAGNDYPSMIQMNYNPETSDYDIKTD